MRILIETIPHDSQLYPTVGDWREDADGTIHIRVSEMGNDDYAALVGLHELVEVLLCRKRGITTEQVDDFDKKYEKKRKAGLKAYQGEPGDHKYAPYRKEHFFATNIEALMSSELGVDWKTYEATIEALP